MNTYASHSPDRFPGALITVEGLDGAGKSSLIAGLIDRLRADGYPLLLTKEPGGTLLGARLKKLLLEEERACSASVEFLLFAADRTEHFEQVILPALARGVVVVSDRMADSAVAYQGYGRGVDPQFIKDVNKVAMQGVEPDVTLYLKISPPSAIERYNLRHGGPQSTMERRGEDFWKKVAQGYEDLAIAHPRIHTLDAELTPDVLVIKAYEIVSAFLLAKKL